MIRYEFDGGGFDGATHYDVTGGWDGLICGIRRYDDYGFPVATDWVGWMAGGATHVTCGECLALMGPFAAEAAPEAPEAAPEAPEAPEAAEAAEVAPEAAEAIGTLTVAIGRNLGSTPMTWDVWGAFIGGVIDAFDEFAPDAEMRGNSSWGDVAEETLTLAWFDRGPLTRRERVALARVASDYAQECIAVTHGATQFVTPESEGF